MTDPIADMLTRIRNANQMRREEVSVPNSKLKRAILTVLKKEGFINGFKVTEGLKSDIIISLRYTKDNIRAIQGLKRVSKPGLRLYSEASELPKVLNGLGIALISTSKGVMTDKEARKLNIGGEVLAYVW